MAKVQYKQKDGVLHIGGGRFFHARKPVQVESEELEDLLNTYGDLEVVVEGPVTENASGTNDDESYTATSLKKLNAEQQRDIITEFGGDLDSVNNEDERIALILELQEAQKEEKE